MRVADLRAESHRNDVIGIGETAPRLSWITAADTPSWRSAGYEVEIDGSSTGQVDSDESVFVPWPGPALMPVDPWLRAKARAFGLAIACDIHPMNNLGVQRQLKAQFGADAEALAAWGKHWIGGGLNALEASLAKEPVHPFAFGETPSVADICLVPQLANARRAGLEVETWPRLAAVDRVARAHPAFFAAAPENHPHAPKD